MVCNIVKCLVVNIGNRWSVVNLIFVTKSAGIAWNIRHKKYNQLYQRTAKGKSEYSNSIYLIIFHLQI